MSWNFSDTRLQPYMTSAEFGVEKESLRVTPDGRLSHTPHPFSEPYIDRDFCENQTEMISSVHRDVDSLFDELQKIHQKVGNKLQSLNELLWPFSNPPIVESFDDIPIAHFEGELKEREIYRNYLSEKYGKAKMLYSGIHFNFSFSDGLLKAAFGLSDEEDFLCFKNAAYMELGRKLLRYTWLIVYLTAASPLIDENFLRLSGMTSSDRYRYASFRCGEVGYWNDFLPILNFTDTESYTASVKSYIDRGLLYAASELYYPLRLKPRGKNSLDKLKENGINHIELRCLDVNPLSPVGIFKEDIRFIHLLILYLMSLDDTVLDEKAQRVAIENIKNASLYNDIENTVVWDHRSVSIKKAAARILDEVHRFAEKHAPSFLPDVAYQQKKLSGERYAELVRERFDDYIGDGLRLAKSYRG